MRELVSYLLHLLLGSTEGHGNACSERSEYFDLAARMIESTVERGQLAPSTESSAFIEQASLPRTMRCTKHVLTFQQQGILQDALREAIAATDDPSQAERWSGYLSASINNLVSNLTNATRDSELPLDRFSVGSSALLEYVNASLADGNG